MASEKEWVRSLQPRLEESLGPCGVGPWRVMVYTSEKLTYAHEILCYRGDDTVQSRCASYETDLLLCDVCESGDWIPRVVVECKLGGVTTHDALTYSTKAATHKQVHPYLRYGTLIGNFDDALPGRLIRHGAFFDFMMVWVAEAGSGEEWADLIKLLADEVTASRRLQELLTESRLRGRKRFRLLHRPLVLVPSPEKHDEVLPEADQPPPASEPSTSTEPQAPEA